MHGLWPARTSPGTRVPGSVAVSLIELLVVLAVLGLLLAVAAPAFVTLGPSRKAGIHEVAGFLEHARAQAVATKREMIVVFADEDFPDIDRALRSYALFAAYQNNPDDPDSLRQVSTWRTLPKGLLFARGGHFTVSDGDPFRTLMDRAAWRSVPVPDARGAESGLRSLPCIVFGPDGSVREPAFHDADALHVGVIEGYLDAASRQVVLTAGQNDGKASGECLAVGSYTGRARLLTD